MLQTVHGNKALTHTCDFDWFKEFKEDMITTKMIQRVDKVINCSKSINSCKIL